MSAPHSGRNVPGAAEDERLMRLAVATAREAPTHDDVPVGCVVSQGGRVIATARNERELRSDPTAHAEVLALRAAALSLGGWRLVGCQVHVTLEPCPMCAGALLAARVERVVFGAADLKLGAAGSVTQVLRDPRAPTRVGVSGGILAKECSSVLGDFFASRR
jgi:tRNA(adenine34) deaminase